MCQREKKIHWDESWRLDFITVRHTWACGGLPRKHKRWDWVWSLGGWLEDAVVEEDQIHKVPTCS